MTLFSPPIERFDYTKKCKKCHFLAIQKTEKGYWCVNCEKYVEVEEIEKKK